MSGQALPDQGVSWDLLDPHWAFDCLDCDAFDTYGHEDIRQLALGHVRETGHTLSVSRRQAGHLRPALDEKGQTDG